MNPRVRDIFMDVVDLSPDARARYFATNSVEDEVRREVEALAAYDSGATAAILQPIAHLAAIASASARPEDIQCGPYRLRMLLGRGGMGAVYAAERVDGEVKQKVAVKLLRPGFDFPEVRARFFAERQILATLNHPGLARLLDAGHTASGQPYLVMDFIDGTPIDEYSGKLSTREKLTLFLQVCDAVSYAHRNLVVHRDIKPSNILVDSAGVPKLLDFGIAKLLEGADHFAGSSQLTVEGSGALTPEYAAPEQLTGEAITTATDVYALGVLLFVLLTGEHPAGRATRSSADLFKLILEVEARKLSQVDVRLRGDVETIVAKALKKKPQERYPSVEALADDLRRHLKHQPISARPDTIGYRTAKFVRRHRTATVLASVALATTVSGGVGIFIEAKAAREQCDVATRQLARAEAMNDLNSFILSDAAPLGKPLTVNELLVRAEHIVQNQQPENDRSRVDLLISIGRQYYSQDEDTKSIRVLEEAYRLAQLSSDRPTRAESACALASSTARAGDFTRADALLKEGISQVSGQQFMLERIFCLQRGSEIARERGTSKDAIRMALEAQSLLRKSPFRSQLMDMHALMGVAESYRSAGQYKEASSAFEQAAALLTALGRENTQTAGTLFNNWGLALQFLGRPLEAERVFHRAIVISSSNGNEQGVSPMLLVNYARVLRELARFPEAADFAERGYQKAVEAGDQIVINQSLMMRSAIYRAMGDVSLAKATISEVEPRLRRMLPDGHIAFASLNADKALIAETAGDISAALRFINEAFTIAESSIGKGGDGQDFLPVLHVRRASIELKLGRVDDAVADAKRAVGMLEQDMGSVARSSGLGRAYLMLGRSLQAKGERQEALSYLSSAERNLENTVGLDHPDTRDAISLAGKLSKKS